MAGAGMAGAGEERRRVALRRAVEALPLRVREVYRLSAVEGLAHGAIAERLGIGLGEVEARLAEAIVLIDRLIGADGAG